MTIYHHSVGTSLAACLSQRLKYKVILITCKAFNDTASMYIKDLLEFTTSFSSSTSDDPLLLRQLKNKMGNYFGVRAFSCITLLLWNRLQLKLCECQLTPDLKFQLKPTYSRVITADITYRING